MYASIPEYGDVPQKLIALRTELGATLWNERITPLRWPIIWDVPQSEEVRTLEYRLAQTCYDEGCYEYATKAYELLGQYELSVSKLPVARYAYAAQLFDEGKYAEAAEQFTLLQGSTDSAERAKEPFISLDWSNWRRRPTPRRSRPLAVFPAIGTRTIRRGNAIIGRLRMKWPQETTQRPRKALKLSVAILTALYRQRNVAISLRKPILHPAGSPMRRSSTKR